jgi:hypothetical protein
MTRARLLVVLLAGCAAPPAPTQALQSSLCVTDPLEEALNTANGAQPPNWRVVDWLPGDGYLPGNPNEKNWTKAFIRGVQSLSAGAAQCAGCIDHQSTLYVPKGTYYITGTIPINANGVRIIGEAAPTTIIRWAGAVYDPTKDPKLDNGQSVPGSGDWVATKGAWMFKIDGAGHHAELRNLTLDGASHAEAAVRLAFDFETHTWTDFQNNVRQKGSPTGFRFSDLIIENAARGIDAGRYPSSQDSEGLVLRCRFTGIGKQAEQFTSAQPMLAAVRVRGANAMNWQIWDSVFRDNVSGVSGGDASGTFNIFNSQFLSSHFSDAPSGSRRPMCCAATRPWTRSTSSAPGDRTSTATSWRA